MRILIIEDDIFSQRLIKHYATLYGKCTTAMNGKEGLETFFEALNNNPFDLIFLDIMMPEMNGQDVLKLIRSIESQYNIPAGKGAKIIMVTAREDSKNIMQAFREQCDGYLKKPISKKLFIEQLNNLGFLERQIDNIHEHQV